MARLLSTLPVGMDMEQLLNYYLNNMLMSAFLRQCVASRLICNGAFVSTQDGWTALHLAALEGKVDVVRLLLTEAQALVNIQSKVHSHHITTND